MGYSHIVVLGSVTYYLKFGYVPANKFGIYPPFDVPSENFMAICFDENVKISGLVEYAKEFGV